MAVVKLQLEQLRCGWIVHPDGLISARTADIKGYAKLNKAARALEVDMRLNDTDSRIARLMVDFHAILNTIYGISVCRGSVLLVPFLFVHYRQKSCLESAEKTNVQEHRSEEHPTVPTVAEAPNGQYVVR